MSAAIDDTRLPALFVHTTRKQWGVGVLAWEAKGKRAYLFEDGQERTMASGFDELMRRVERPNAEQQATSLRLQRALAKRARSAAGAAAPTFSDQLARFRDSFPAGLQDPKWVKNVRGEGEDARATVFRTAAIEEARELLSPSALESLIGSQGVEDVADRVFSVLNRTDLVPAAQLKRAKSPNGEQLRDLVQALRELLYGKSPYDQRFNRYVAVLSAYVGKPAGWELATVIPALVHPSEQVCVHAAAFRLQLKVNGSRGTIATRPTGTEYARLLSLARGIFKKLGEQGEAPRDLLDVHDFIRVTCKPTAKDALSEGEGS